ncbi:MAG: hypothetical protein QXE01_07240 [Sulfolobales archaeon]
MDIGEVCVVVVSVGGVVVVIVSVGDVVVVVVVLSLDPNKIIVTTSCSELTEHAQSTPIITKLWSDPSSIKQRCRFEIALTIPGPNNTVVIWLNKEALEGQLSTSTGREYVFENILKHELCHAFMYSNLRLIHKVRTEGVLHSSQQSIDLELSNIAVLIANTIATIPIDGVTDLIGRRYFGETYWKAVAAEAEKFLSKLAQYEGLLFVVPVLREIIDCVYRGRCSKNLNKAVLEFYKAPTTNRATKLVELLMSVMRKHGMKAYTKVYKADQYTVQEVVLSLHFLVANLF